MNQIANLIIAVILALSVGQFSKSQLLYFIYYITNIDLASDTSQDDIQQGMYM